MKNQVLAEKFARLSTPPIADAALRLKIPLRIAPSANFSFRIFSVDIGFRWKCGGRLP